MIGGAKRIRGDVAALALILISLIFVLGDRFASRSAHRVAGSVAPALADGDVAVVERNAQLSRFDIVMFEWERREAGARRGERRRYLGRVVALPGETLTVTGASVQIGGQVVARAGRSYATTIEALLVPVDHCFVVGDIATFHSDATDSVRLGPLPTNKLRKVVRVFKRAEWFSALPQLASGAIVLVVLILAPGIVWLNATRSCLLTLFSGAWTVLIVSLLALGLWRDGASIFSTLIALHFRYAELVAAFFGDSAIAAVVRDGGLIIAAMLGAISVVAARRHRNAGTA